MFKYILSGRSGCGDNVWVKMIHLMLYFKIIKLVTILHRSPPKKKKKIYEGKIIYCVKVEISTPEEEDKWKTQQILYL